MADEQAPVIPRINIIVPGGAPANDVHMQDASDEAASPSTSGAPSRPSSPPRPSSPQGGHQISPALREDISERHAQFFNVMNAMRENGELCDTALVVDGNEIKVHRVVLSACSCYFRAMFTSNMAEAQSPKVTLHDVSIGTVKAIVDFAYRAEITLDDENVQELLSAANRYQIEPIKEACSNYLKSQLSASNCIGIRDYAEFHNCADLLSSAIRYLDTHFQEAYENDEFLALEPAAVVALLKRDELTVSSEDEIYKAAIRWLRNSAERGAPHKKSLFAAVRFPLVTRRYLINEIKDEPLLQDCCQCLKLVLDGMQYHLMDPEERVAFAQTNVQARQKKYDFKIAVFGGNEQSSCQYFDCKALKWVDFPTMCEKRKDHCVAKVKNCVYVLAGSSLFLHSRIDCFNIASQKWSTMNARLDIGRDAAAACVQGNYIYITGGTRNHGATAINSAHCLQPELERVIALPPMLQERFDHGIVECKGSLYVCGGATNGAAELKHCERYNVTTNRWNKIPPMQKSRRGVGLASLGGRIYAIGGQNEQGIAQDSMERFDPVLGTWAFRAKMPYKLRHVKCAVIEDSVWVVAGLKDVGRLTNVLEYRPVEDRWLFHHNTKAFPFGNAALCTVDTSVTE